MLIIKFSHRFIKSHYTYFKTQMKAQLIYEWKIANLNDTFLNQKHDPNYLFSGKGFYSKVTPEISGSLNQFLNPEILSIYRFDDMNYVGGKGYFEIQINSYHKYVGYISLDYPKVDILCDRLIGVYGDEVGWHIYAQSQNYISSSISNGRLLNKRVIT